MRWKSSNLVCLLSFVSHDSVSVNVELLLVLWTENSCLAGSDTSIFCLYSMFWLYIPLLFRRKVSCGKTFAKALAFDKHQHIGERNMIGALALTLMILYVVGLSFMMLWTLAQRTSVWACVREGARCLFAFANPPMFVPVRAIDRKSRWNKNFRQQFNLRRPYTLNGSIHYKTRCGF